MRIWTELGMAWPRCFSLIIPDASIEERRNVDMKRHRDLMTTDIRKVLTAQM